MCGLDEEGGDAKSLPRLQGVRGSMEMQVDDPLVSHIEPTTVATPILSVY